MVHQILSVSTEPQCKQSHRQIRYFVWVIFSCQYIHKIFQPDKAIHCMLPHIHNMRRRLLYILEYTDLRSVTLSGSYSAANTSTRFSSRTRLSIVCSHTSITCGGDCCIFLSTPISGKICSSALSLSNIRSEVLGCACNKIRKSSSRNLSAETSGSLPTACLMCSRVSA